jgi:hypothetical protein
MIDFDNQFSLPEDIKIIERCPLCSSSKKKLKARTLRENIDRQIVHIHCQECLGSIIAIFMVSGMGITSYGLVTDLSYDDVQKFNHLNEIDLDDVIRAYENLKMDHFLARIRHS